MNAEILLAKVEQYPLAIGCLLVIAVVGAAGFFRGGNQAQLQADYDATSQEYGRINSNRENAVNLEEDLQNLEAMVAQIDSRLIDPGAKTDNYRYFLAMAERTHVNLVDPSAGTMVPDKDTGLKQYGIMKLTLSVSGEYEQVMDFLYELRTGNHFTRINEVSLAPATGTGQYRVQANVQISCLARRPG